MRDRDRRDRWRCVSCGRTQDELDELGNRACECGDGYAGCATVDLDLEAIEEGRRVLANKTRSFVSAARELAEAAISLAADRDHWKARALAAEDSRRRTFTSVPRELVDSVARQFRERIDELGKRVEEARLDTCSPDDLNAFAQAAHGAALDLSRHPPGDGPSPDAPAEAGQEQAGLRDA